LKSTKAISYAIIIISIDILVIASFLFSLSVTESMPVAEPADSTSTRAHAASFNEAGDRTDRNMTFLMLPEEASVKVNETFTIQIGVENATDMYGWQVYLSYDPEMLRCVDVHLPSDHVFSFRITAGDALVEYDSTAFANPLRKIQNSEGWTLAGNCLLGRKQSTFTGSGILCQVELKAIGCGVSPIKLLLDSNFGPFILDSNLRGAKPPSTVESLVTCTED